MREKIRRLLYLRRELDNLIDNMIGDYILRGWEVDTEVFRESIIYHLDDNLQALKEGR